MKKLFWFLLVKKLVLLIIFCFFVSPIFAFEASLEPGVHKVLDSDSQLSKAWGSNFAAMLFMPAGNVRYVAAFEFPFLQIDSASTVKSFNVANLNLGVDYEFFKLFNRFSVRFGALFGPTFLREVRQELFLDIDRLGFGVNISPMVSMEMGTGSFIFFTRVQAHYYKLFGDIRTNTLSSINANLGVKIFME